MYVLVEGLCLQTDTRVSVMKTLNVTQICVYTDFNVRMCVEINLWVCNVSCVLIRLSKVKFPILAGASQSAGQAISMFFQCLCELSSGTPVSPTGHKHAFEVNCGL